MVERWIDRFEGDEGGGLTGNLPPQEFAWGQRQQHQRRKTLFVPSC